MIAVCLVFLLVGIDVMQASAQTAPGDVTGTWIGELKDSSGRIEFYSATIDEASMPRGTASLPLRGLAGPIQSISLAGGQARIAGPASLILSGTLAGDRLTGSFEAQAGRSTGSFSLKRIPTIDADALAQFPGAYRAPGGGMFLIDQAELDGRYIPSALAVTDSTTGAVRIAFASGAGTFVAGSGLLTPEPAEFTMTFRMATGRVTGMTVSPRLGTAINADRVEIAEQQVSFRNNSVELSGTLLMPSTSGPHPAMVLTHGGGAAVRRWYWGLGYLLAVRGIAVLAYDKRGVGQSTGDWRTASFEDLADDAVAGARFLQGHPDLDRTRIGFWGLSQGAWIAPLAAVRAGDAAFVVTLSGGGLTPNQGELLDSEWELRSAGVVEEDVREALEFQKARDVFMRSGTAWADYEARRARAIEARAPWYGFLGTDLSGPSTPDSPEWEYRKRSYFYDPVPTLRSLRAPILSIFGALDTPAGVEGNITALRTALVEGGNRDFTITVFRHGRHNLMDSAGVENGSLIRLERLVPGVFELMSSWLADRTRR